MGRRPHAKGCWSAALVLGTVTLATGCTVEQTGAGGGSGSGGGGGGGRADGGSEGGPATGSDCTIQATSATLCEKISTCPSITVDQNTFNQCGFLIHGSALDLECECSGYLCPVGITTTCAAVSMLLAQESSSEVCNQLASGGCTYEIFSTGSGSGSGGACDPTCESQCLSDPSCIQACGC